MKSFISSNVQRIIDLNDNLLDKSSAQKSFSITGDKLSLLGKLPVVNFGKFKSKVTCTSYFISYQLGVSTLTTVDREHVQRLLYKYTVPETPRGR